MCGYTEQELRQIAAEKREQIKQLENDVELIEASADAKAEASARVAERDRELGVKTVSARDMGMVEPLYEDVETTSTTEAEPALTPA